MITAYTHDEYCDMFLNIGVSNNEALLVHGNLC